jgi:hypothetical protein
MNEALAPAGLADDPAPLVHADTHLPATVDNLTLMRHYEPIVCFTKGEPFFPSDVQRYLAECSLWAHLPNGHEEELVPDRQVDEATLVAARELPFGTVAYLKLVGPLNLQESANALRLRSQQQKESGDRFRAGQGRLARVGYVSRIVDALFSVSLWLRGRVPGATAAVAELEYQRAHAADERYVYYGRVIRDSGWVVLQYWFFYWYNSWRSGFHGVNDHESDWEQVAVYLYEGANGDLLPEWVAYASHDFHGSDLRRRWDDSAGFTREGTHPVVYAGAGSHASYYLRGEYQTDVSLPLPERLQKVNAFLRRTWTNALGQASRQPDTASPFRIPFVDFARGDGVQVGAHRPKAWSPVLMDPVPDWAFGFRGLWGLYARDPISGENAPAGPMYNRDGSPRSAWYDPLGFAGLDHVPPPPQERRLLERRRHELAERQAAIEAEILDRSSELQEQGTQLEALAEQPHMAREYRQLALILKADAEALNALRREQVENVVLLESLERRANRLASGYADAAHAHIVHYARPATAAELRFNRLAEVWAAMSVSLLVIGAIAIALFLGQIPLQDRVVAIGGLIVLFLLVDSVLRGTFAHTVNAVSVALAVVAVAVLIWTFWAEALIIAIVLAGLFLLAENLRELSA